MKVYGLHSSPILNVSRWWQLKYFLFSYLFGEDSQFDEYFSNGLVQPPTIDVFFLKRIPWWPLEFLLPAKGRVGRFKLAISKDFVLRNKTNGSIHGVFFLREVSVSRPSTERRLVACCVKCFRRFDRLTLGGWVVQIFPDVSSASHVNRPPKR